MRGETRDRVGRIGDGGPNGGGLADETGGGGCCDHSQPGGTPRHTELATVGVVGVGGVMLLCCAGPVLLSTGLLAAGAGAALGAGAVGVVGVIAVLVGLRGIRSRRIGAESQGPTLPDGCSMDGPDANSPNYVDRSRKRF